MARETEKLSTRSEKADVNIFQHSLFSSEKTTSIRQPRGVIRRRIHVLALTCTAVCGAFLWWISNCFIAGDGRTEFGTSRSKSFGLVKNAIQVALATPAATVLECFQVYQPVLFPAGAVDQVAVTDGTESTTTILPTKPNSSCQVLLMEHSFGYSYGMPFIG